MPVKTATLGGRLCRIDAHRLHGEAWSPEMGPDPTTPYLWYDDTLGGRASLETLIHEAMHIQRPRALEQTIEQDARELARLLWRIGYSKK